MTGKINEDEACAAGQRGDLLDCGEEGVRVQMDYDS